MRIGQQDILDLLKKYPNKWFDTVEIRKLTKLGFSSVHNSTSKLRRDGFVKFVTRENLRNKGGAFKYWYKHKR